MEVMVNLSPLRNPLISVSSGHHYAAPFVLCCMLGWMSASFAAGSPSKSFQIKEEETQLAKRLAIREAVESPFEYTFSAGLRQDNFGWSIANGNINVASEVNWKKTVIGQMRAAAKFNFLNGWLLRGIYSTGAVKTGSNQDSDFAGSNRTQEYSRSDNRTGGAIRDISFGLGRKIHLFDFENGEMMYVVPLAGLSVHQQSLTMYDGQQIIPANGPLFGLNNSYDTKWQGAWLGADALVGLGGNVYLNYSVEYHQVDYTAEANWNLRNDFAHPVSFKHVARGHGVLASIGASYRFRRDFLMNVSLEKQRWTTAMGYDQTNFSYGTTNYYPLNPVNWDSRAFFVGAAYQF